MGGRTSPPLLLLPQPQSVRRLAGTFRLTGRVAIGLDAASGRQELAAARQLAADLGRLGIEGAVARRAGDADKAGGIVVHRGRAKGGPEAYTLRVRTRGAEIVAPGPQGAYYGLQTLRQLVRQFGDRLPALAIEDGPDFPVRSVYHDISRGRVPTLETLKYLVELLAHLKVNSLSLYMEYPFRYERHPRLWEDTRPLTAEEILELKDFAADHCVDLVPSQASFGHLERLLSKPPYRRLANTPARRTLAETRRPGRCGTSLDPTNPASERLLADLYDGLLPQFDSPWFNACCDEVWDLGEGRSAARARRIGKGALFAEFVTKVHKLSRRHGKRTMIWADILRHHPEEMAQTASRLPKDLILLNWWYYPNRVRECMFEHSRFIRESGYDLIVCPGVNNWGAFMPRIEQMRDNVRLFAGAAKRYKALGMLNTEWGDGGHYNLLATALPGFASGAEHSWSHGSADPATIGRRWPLHVLGDRAGDAERIVTLADYAPGEYRPTFTGFGNEREIDFDMLRTTPARLLARQRRFNDRLLEAMDTALRLSRALGTEDWTGASAAHGFLAAMEYAALTAFTLAKGYAVCAQLYRQTGKTRESRRLFCRAADATADLLPDYKDLWLRRNHKSELDWSVKRFQQAIRRWRRAAKNT